jgi:hypothetical protein
MHSKIFIQMQKSTGVEKKHMEWEEKNSTKLLSTLCYCVSKHFAMVVDCGAEKESSPVKTK